MLLLQVPRSILGVIGLAIIALWTKTWHAAFRKNYHPVKVEMCNIQRHLVKTQKPARLLGMRVHDVQDNSLSLSAPLSMNHNVHGAAFAGSLYSVGVLTSFYLGRSWVIRNGLDRYTLVAKSGSIRYLRPVTSNFVAKSTLPSAKKLKAFHWNLLLRGKATLNVDGKIIFNDERKNGSNREDNRAACEYSIELCGYLPR